MIKTGMIIEDRYEVLEKIGTGGMSEVFKARDKKLNRLVAMKFLKPEFCEDKNFVGNFKVEAQSAAALLHPNVVNVYDVNETNGTYYIVMEYVDGTTLKKYIDVNGKLPVKEATSIAINVVQGMEAAHNAGIVHRDIKPQNVLISRDGKIKVTDFGIARTTTANTISSDVLGSAQYISPEQARGDVVDARSDIYSFGISFYEMLTGQLPFDGDSPVTVALKHIQDQVPPVSDIVKDVPKSLVKIVEKCTQKRPEKRYQKASYLLEDLKKSLMNPNDDFVIIDSEEDTGATVIMSKKDAEMLRNEGRNADLAEGRNSKTGRKYVSDTPNDDDDQDEDEYEKPDNSGKKFDKVLTICGIAAGAIIVIVLALVLVTNVFGNGCAGCSGQGQNETTTDAESTAEASSTAAKVEVPNLVGMDVAAAKTALDTLKLKYSVTEEQSDKPQNQVIRQSLADGTQVDEGTTITLTVSSGSKTVKLADLTGKSRSTAITTLTNAKLNYTIETEYSDTVEEGYVIRTDPKAGSTVSEGSTVTLYISLGTETEKAIVNDCVEVGEERSVAALESRGFVVSVSYEHSDTVEAGIVISQSPVANTEAEVGSTVYLVVSSGPDTTYVTVPYCIGFTQTGARELCEDAGLVVSISEIPDNDNIGRVLTQSIESGESVEEGTTIVLGVGVEEETEAPSTESTRETATEGSSSGEETTS
mgnify:CR=1 FL=1